MEFTLLDLFGQLFFGIGSVILLTLLWKYSDYLSDGNVDRLEKETNQNVQLKFPF